MGNKTFQSISKTWVFAWLGLTILLITTFVNCSKSKSHQSGAEPVVSQSESISIKTLEIQNYSLGGNLNYETRLLKIESNNSSTPVYAQFVKSCPSGQCPVVVISDPYSGISWSGETIDAQWCGRANATTGYSWSDENGPLYQVGSSIGTLNYKCNSPQEAANIGGLFLLSEINIMIIYGRFYAGRTLDDYVNEFVRASESLNQISEVDINRVAFFGASLGGFITLNSALRTNAKLKGLVVMSPLIDIGEQLDYIESLPSKVNANSSLLSRFQKFFDPYQRRVYGFTGGARLPSASTQYEKFRPSSVSANLKVPTLLIEDDWDTLIPVAPAKQMADAIPSQVNKIWFQHATGIDYNTFVMDHRQPGEGLTGNNTYPLYMLYLFDLLIPEVANPNLYYDYNELTLAFSQFRQAQSRGQNIQWLRPLGLKFCRSGLSMIDLSSSGMTMSARAYLAGIVTNLWGITKSENEVCNYLQSSNWPN